MAPYTAKSYHSIALARQTATSPRRRALGCGRLRRAASSAGPRGSRTRCSIQLARMADPVDLDPAPFQPRQCVQQVRQIARRDQDDVVSRHDVDVQRSDSAPVLQPTRPLTVISTANRSAHQLGQVLAEPPDLDELESERLQPVQHAVQRRLVRDDAREHGLGGYDGRAAGTRTPRAPRRTVARGRGSRTPSATPARTSVPDWDPPCPRPSAARPHPLRVIRRASRCRLRPRVASTTQAARRQADGDMTDVEAARRGGRCRTPRRPARPARHQAGAAARAAERTCRAPHVDELLDRGHQRPADGGQRRAPAGARRSPTAHWAGCRARRRARGLGLPRRERQRAAAVLVLLRRGPADGGARCPPDNPLAELVPGLGSEDEYLQRLLAGLAQLPAPVVVVLDDFHLIDDARGARAAWPSCSGTGWTGCRLVLLTRSDPPLPLHRLRISDELAEIRPRDLAFDAAGRGDDARAARRLA